MNIATKKYRNFYNAQFYSGQADNSYQSAKEVLKVLFDIYRPRSIVDFGCGQGTWLTAAEELGVADLKGYDGDWVDTSKLYSKNINFEPVNLDQKVEVEKKYDLAISLEVAEHLKEKSAKNFVQSICNASDVILFSPAIKGQGGTNHINEQWQSYWIDLFKNNKYNCFDIIRSQIWDDENVEWWYRQNTFVFVNKGVAMDRLEMESASLYDVIHPIAFSRVVEDSKMKNYTFQKKSKQIEMQNEIKVAQEKQQEERKKQEAMKKQQQKERVKYNTLKNSKSFRLGNLFFVLLRSPISY